MFGVYKGAGDAAAAYNNKTLVHNWWEDRIMNQEGGPDAAAMTSTSNRVFAADLAGSDFKPDTTKRRTDANLLQALEAEKATAAAATGQERAKVAGKGGRGPSMFSGKHSCAERLQAYGLEASADADVLLFDGTTTNKLAYEDGPAAARSSFGSDLRQGYYDVGGDTGRKHFKNSTLEREKSAMSSAGVSSGSAELTTCVDWDWDWDRARRVDGGIYQEPKGAREPIRSVGVCG